MFSRYFIDRPIFAWVIALGILLAGGLSLQSLPIEQYPDVAPPSLQISVVYPGADAATLEQNVTQVIEQELNGVEGYLYMSSTSRSNGTAAITLTFEAGTDIDTAQVNVQNRLSRVESRLPEEVRRQGINVTEANSGFLMIVALTSKSGATDSTELGNIASNRIIDELRRVEGVGDIRLFGSPYAMRIWLDPDKLASFSLSPAEALAAVQEQNSQTPGGSLGDQPIADGAVLNATIITQNRFQRPEQFSNIILRANPDGSTVTLADVARIELGAQDYVSGTELNGKPTAAMAVQLRTGANALATGNGIKARMAELSAGLPDDVSWSVPYDTTPFIEVSVDEVIKTLIEAMILVFLVMLLFLQNWRATVIATIVVPIALAGACLGLFLFDFSINVLSLLAMVLAIGILVDDAIVVIENTERIMASEHLSPREASIKAMGEISGAILGITLVLIAVFVPMAFFPGSTGGIYRQFSVTLAVSIAFSALIAFTLTPALCATLLKSHAERENTSGSWLQRVPGLAPVARIGGRFAAWFNRTFARTTESYQRRVGTMLTAPLRWLGVFAVVAVLTVVIFARVPGGFLPQEDQGYIISVIQAPPGSTRQQTDKAIRATQSFYAQQPQVENTIAVRGFSFFGQGQSAAMVFASLHPWEERPGAANSAQALAGKAFGTLIRVKEAFIFTLSPPPIQALGNATGFSFRLQARNGQSAEELAAARDTLLGMAAQSPVLTNVRPEGQAPAPQLVVDIDRVRARALHLAISDVNATLSIAAGSAYANDFNLEGRVRRVYLQADAPFRMTPRDILNLRVRNSDGQMVPFGSFTTASWSAGPPQLARYNGYPSEAISGEAKPGYSSGQALSEMETLAGELPGGFDFEWTGTSFEEKQAGGQIGVLLLLSLVIVFLVLSALYESWAVPLAVLLVVPLGVLGAALLTLGRGFSADIYFNVGLITIIGLSAKNAILIIEFAIEREAGEGVGIREALLEAVNLRLRPIIMTALAFILGMVPLVLATGAGAASRSAVGTGVMGGMITATVLGIFFTPVFYFAVRTWLTRTKPKADDEPETTVADNA
ncbi:MAG: efflux RND transporter permease subunit [Erythrobacter sp.]